MNRAEPIITTARAEAYSASLLRVLAWLLTLILRLAPIGRSARLRDWLSRAERTAESVLFLKAAALHGPPPRRKLHPRSAAPGFRRVEARRLRLFFRGAGVRARKASPLARVIALIEALANPQRAVVYFLKQIARGLHFGRLIPLAPPAYALAAGAPATADGPDTS